MQWSYQPNAGFSTADPEKLIRPVIDQGEFGYEQVNVTAQRHDHDVAAGLVRADDPDAAGGPGGRRRLDCTHVDVPMPAGVLAHRADGATGTMLFLHNLGTEDVEVDLSTLAAEADLPERRPRRPGLRRGRQAGQPEAGRPRLPLDPALPVRHLLTAYPSPAGRGAGRRRVVRSAAGLSSSDRATSYREVIVSEEPRVAIVTGAARGIGAATARRLAADGLAVAVVDIDEAATGQTVDAITAAGGRALGVGADVADRAQVEAAVARVAAELGAPTVLVNNAGVLRDNLLFKMTDADWDTVLGVHLRGAFLFSQAAQKHMVEQKYGRIVNLSSTSALGNRGQANYAAAKAGLQGFTKTLAIELGPFGVTANAVAPGFIVTDMTAATAARMKVDFDDLQKHAAAEIPVRRPGRPEDVAHTISFLVSEGAVVRLRPGHLRRGRPEGLTGTTRHRRPVRTGRRCRSGGRSGGRPDGGAGQAAVRLGGCQAAMGASVPEPVRVRVRQSQSSPSTGSTSGM